MVRTAVVENRGAVHADLLGGSSGLRFRAERLDAGELKHELNCVFRHEEKVLGPLRVLDSSPTGIGLDPEEQCYLAPGSALEELEITYRGEPVWRGSGTVVYQVQTPRPRVGVRFTSGLFDPRRLRLSDSIDGGHLAHVLRTQKTYTEQLPAEWRSQIAGLQQLMKIAQDTLSEQEPGGQGDFDDQEQAMIGAVSDQWGPSYFAQLDALEEASRRLDPGVVELARKYATRELLPHFYDCPIHRRAYDKPRGYAGDYRLMTMFFRETPEAPTGYGRFLHHIAQRYPLGRTVVARERTVRGAVLEAMATRRPARIISLACGAALELRNALGEIRDIPSPVDVLLIDQDEEALQYAYETFSSQLLHSRFTALRPSYLHLSVRQILRPQNMAEREVNKRELRDADLIYSVGLFDYLPDPVAKVLLTRLYSMLRPGGRLFIGNLDAAQGTSWLMEYVFAWHLEYRSKEAMLDLATHLQPAPKQKRVVTDSTEYCAFLDVTRPTD